ncbi:MAG: 4Fe-4S binding protein [Thermodesulfobacteriota bacterium]
MNKPCPGYPLKPCPQDVSPRPGRESAPSEWADEEAVREASRCLALRSCESCDLCRLLCPDLCITRNPESGLIEIDYDFCKGCGICAFICPKGAIRMEREL